MRNFRLGVSARLWARFLLLCVLCHAGRALAQQDEGTITGTVTDVTGAVIPRAVVTVKQVETDLTLTRTADASGVFTISPLKIGTYELRVSASGFQTLDRSGLQLHAQERLNVNAQLTLGVATQTVQVTTEAPQMQTQESSVGQTISSGAINDTALNGRNYVYIAQLTMGVAPGTQGSRGEQKGDFSANGQRSEQNNFILDGVDNNVNLADFLNGASYVIKPPPDALQEFSVQTSNYSAELGHAAGGVVNASIKSGTNAVHGSIWEFFRNDKLNAIDWFSLGKPEYRQNQFGATLGGPLLRNRLFLFGDAEANRIVFQETSNFYSVPTALMRNSGFTNFTELLSTNTALNTTVKTLYQPGGPVKGTTNTNLQACNGIQNTLCPSQVNANAVRLLNQFPAPNYGPAGKTYNNYLFAGRVTDNTTQYDVRSDWNLSQKNQAFARYSYSQNPQSYPSPLGPILDGGSFSADGQIQVEGRNFTLSETHVFNQALVNEIRFGYNWIHAAFQQENSSANLAPQFGLGNIPFSPGNGGLPGLTISGLSTAGTPGFYPSQEYENVAQLLDNVTYTLGSHALKFGVNLQRIRNSTLQPSRGRGNFSFTGLYSDNPSSTATSGSGIVDFVEDHVASATINNLYTTEDQRWYDAVYVQDDWRTTPKLTLNLGLRWEYVQPIVELHDHQANFVPGAYALAGTSTAPNFVSGSGIYLIPSSQRNYPIPPVFAASLAKNNIGIQYTNNRSLVQSHLTNFAPRVGLAYTIDNKLVLRAGFGIFYGGLENVGYGPNIGQSLPFAISDSLPAQTCSSPTSCTFSLVTLETGFAGLLQADGTLSPTALVNPGVKSLAYTNKTAYTESYNLSVQYALSKSVAWTVAYVGNVDRHLQAQSSLNTYDGLLPPGTSYSSYLPLGGGLPGNAGNYSLYGLSGGGYIVDSGMGNYNALQTKLEKSTRKNVSFLATYTYSHALDDARPPLNGYAGQAAYRLPQWLGISYDYGSDLQDVRQRATFNGHYVLPVGRGQAYLNKTGWTDEVVGGWETSLTFRVQSGNPAELVANNTLGNGTAYAIRVADPFATNLPAPDPTGTPTLSANFCSSVTKTHTVQHWFNGCAFRNPVSVTSANYNQLPLSSFYGGPGSTTVVGPGYNRIDATLFKNFAIVREKRAQFRADVFNLLNTPAHGQPATNVGGGGGAETNQTQNGAFGQITSERFHGEQPDSRVIQISMKLQF